ncbi:MAG: hypothetical protein R3E32_25720 [Chitinophagales bacterium]
MKEQTRIWWLTTVNILAAMATMLFSFKLWVSTRFFPNVPISSQLPEIAYPFDYVLFGMALLFLVLLLLQRKRRWLIGFLTVAIILCIFDQMRWQPWFYLYLLLFALLLIVHIPFSNRKRERIVFTVAALILSSMYFWSGVHKLHSGFANFVYPYLVETFGMQIDKTKTIHTVLAYGMALSELGIGLALLWKPSRKYAIIAALGMHLFILVVLGPFGRAENLVIVPWNVAMMVLVVVVFYRNEEVSLQSLLLPSMLSVNLLRWGIVVLVVVMPLFSHFGMWDYYLSNTLYAGKTTRLLVVMPKENYEDRLPIAIRQHTQAVSNTPLFVYINADIWALKELNVPVYPQARVQYAIARYFCDYFSQWENRGLLFRIDSRWESKKILEQFECKDGK